MSQPNLISIDLAKNVFQVCGMTDRQAVAFNRQLKRKDLVAFMINQAPVEVAMEACYSRATIGTGISRPWAIT
ncbi:MAG: transposase [Cellvibrionaceae bacterium]|jgi:transposase